MDLDEAKDRGNLGRLWGRHRNDRAMIKEAKEMVAFDKEEAAAAAHFPAPQASNNNDDLKEAAKAALMAATSAKETVKNLAGEVKELAGEAKKQNKQVGKHITDLKDIASGHENRLGAVETRVDKVEERLNTAGVFD